MVIQVYQYNRSEYDKNWREKISDHHRINLSTEMEKCKFGKNTSMG